MANVVESNNAVYEIEIGGRSFLCIKEDMGDDDHDVDVFPVDRIDSVEFSFAGSRASACVFVKKVPYRYNGEPALAIYRYLSNCQRNTKADPSETAFPTIKINP